MWMNKSHNAPEGKLAGGQLITNVRTDATEEKLPAYVKRRAA
jgi:hypothetical protein